MDRRLGKKVDAVSVSELLESFWKQERTLLRDSWVNEAGHIRIDTTTGSHVTSASVLDALRIRKESRQSGKKSLCAKDIEDDIVAYKEPAAVIRRLSELVTARAVKQCCLMAKKCQRR
ncbi:hypothetical protein FGB62_247g06 [Gracilaria domingensis]|nr:hypothetical protein FGB62_247g06 [Gracilaria domingensis]